MCWSVEVSVASAVVAWAACAVLVARRRHRDVWYAGYLLTYTLTQVVDVVLWSYDATRSLEACPGRRYTFARAPGAGRDQVPFLVSKYGIPGVVLVQYAAQLAYPSDRHRRLRRCLLAVYAVGAVGMAYASACTVVARAEFPRRHDTLLWGDLEVYTPAVLAVVALTALNFYVCVEPGEPRVLAALLGPFACVVSFLYATERTLALGSKWCTYCLIFSLSYALDPLWGPGPRKGREETEKVPGQAAGEGNMQGSCKMKGA
jgi:hypothetical protein